MKNQSSLPSNYVLKESYDLKGKKENARIQVLFFMICIIFVGIYLLLEPVKSTLHGGLIAVITIVGLVIYMILHELTHGLTISLLSKTKSTYAIRFPFLTTGTEAYLNKRSFIIVCLSPSVLFGLIIGISLFFIPQDYFLSLFIIFVLNFAGSSGDYYQTYIVMKTKRESLIKDDGEKTNIFQEIDLFEGQPN